MGIWKKIKTLDTTFSWSFLGFLIGIVGFAYAFYIENIKKDYSQISYEILSNTNVLDVKEQIGNLQVIYNGEDILQTNRNLKVLTIKISNSGTKNINQSDYDEYQNWGFKILNATIVSNPLVISATNTYLTTSASKLRFDTSNEIIFPKIIFEVGESFSIKVLTISSSKGLLTIKPIGKISGVKNIEVFQSDNKPKSLTFWQKLMLGNIWVHILRFILYFLCLGIVGAFIGITSSALSNYSEKKQIRRNIEKYRKNTKLEKDENMNKIFEIYQEYKKSFIKKAQSILSNEERLKAIITLNDIQRKKLELIKSENQEIFEPYRREFIRESFETYPLNDFVIKKLKDFGVIKIQDNNEVLVNKEFVKVLNDFVYFLNIQ